MVFNFCYGFICVIVMHNKQTSQRNSSECSGAESVLSKGQHIAKVPNSVKVATLFDSPIQRHYAGGTCSHIGHWNHFMLAWIECSQ